MVLLNFSHMCTTAAALALEFNHIPIIASGNNKVKRDEIGSVRPPTVPWKLSSSSSPPSSSSRLERTVRFAYPNQAHGRDRLSLREIEFVMVSGPTFARWKREIEFGRRKLDENGIFAPPPLLPLGPVSAANFTLLYVQHTYYVYGNDINSLRGFSKWYRDKIKIFKLAQMSCQI